MINLTSQLCKVLDGDQTNQRSHRPFPRSSPVPKSPLTPVIIVLAHHQLAGGVIDGGPAGWIRESYVDD
jgi:hypothetical protein